MEAKLLPTLRRKDGRREEGLTMAEAETCHICRETIYAGDPCHFVKVKGQPMRWYCEKCVKGGQKNDDTDGKRY